MALPVHRADRDLRRLVFEDVLTDHHALRSLRDVAAARINVATAEAH